MTNIQEQDYSLWKCYIKTKNTTFLFLSVFYLPLRLNVPFLMYLQPLRSSPCSRQTYR